MGVFAVNLTPSNTSLVSFFANGSDRSSVPITNKELKEVAPATHKLLTAVYAALTGKDAMPEDDATLTASFSNGNFKKFYVPQLCQFNGKPVIQWGKELIGLDSDKALKAPSKREAVTDTKLQFRWANQLGYDEMLLSYSLYIESSDTSIKMYFPVRTAQGEPDEKGKREPIKLTKELEPDFEHFTERNCKDLLKYLGEPAKPSVILRPTQLSTNVTFKVISYNLGQNANWLVIAPNADGYYYPYNQETKKVEFDDSRITPTDGVDGAELKVWANTEIMQTLAAKPIITDEHPATMVVTGVKSTRNGNQQAQVVFRLSESSLAALAGQKEEAPDFDI